MTHSLCAAPIPNDDSTNNNKHQPLTQRQARALVAALSRKTEEAIALDMVADYLELHPVNPSTQPSVNACPSPDKKAGTIPTTHPYRYDRSRPTTPRSGSHFDTDAPRPFPFTTSYNHTSN